MGAANVDDSAEDAVNTDPDCCPPVGDANESHLTAADSPAVRWSSTGLTRAGSTAAAWRYCRAAESTETRNYWSACAPADAVRRRPAAECWPRCSANWRH